MSQGNIWHLNISYIGTGEDEERANHIIVTARKQGKPVYGEGPWWNVAYENVETREAALSALSIDWTRSTQAGGPYSRSDRRCRRRTSRLCGVKSKGSRRNGAWRSRRCVRCWIVAADAEWIVREGMDGRTVWVGRKEFVQIRTWTEEFEGWSIQVERLIDADDDRVVALTRQSGTGKGSGVPVELDLGLIYELKDGRVIRITNYLTHAEALEAAGLSE